MSAVSDEFVPVSQRMDASGEQRAGPAIAAVDERDVADIATAAQLACLLEASAPKPGNVSPGRHFDDLRYEDFLAAAAAIAQPLAGAAARPLGVTIRRAVEAAVRWTPS